MLKKFFRENAIKFGKPRPFQCGVISGVCTPYIHADYARNGVAGRYELVAEIHSSQAPVPLIRSHYTSLLDELEEWLRTGDFAKIPGLWGPAGSQSVLGTMIDVRNEQVHVVDGKVVPKQDFVVVRVR